MSSEQTFFARVVRVTQVYLGPAAERFMARQVRNHLEKEPEKLTARDLGQLLDWIRISVSLLTEDSDIVDEYVAQLSLLAENEATGAQK